MVVNVFEDRTRLKRTDGITKPGVVAIDSVRESARMNEEALGTSQYTHFRYGKLGLVSIL